MSKSGKAGTHNGRRLGPNKPTLMTQMGLVIMTVAAPTNVNKTIPS